MPDKENKKVVQKKARRKTNLLKLYSQMNKSSLDAVDKEVAKRFRTLIDTIEEDITKSSLQQILKSSKDVVLSSFHENLQPYVKHFIFMSKREKR
jgi:hypothetical protein